MESAPAPFPEPEELLTVSVSDGFISFDRDFPAAKRTERGFVGLDRRSGRLVAKFQDMPAPEAYPVKCLLGVLKLLAGPYLLIATDTERVGMLDGAVVEQIKAVALLPISRRPLSKQELHTESTYIRLVSTLLSDGTFYFSLGSDLSCSRHALAKGQGECHQFSWSHGLRQKFLALTKAETVPQGSLLLRYAPAVIRGFVEFTDLGQGLTLCLISRLSHKRVGRRYTKRGADKEGNVANHVETEQRIYNANASTSYLQVRGSIPVLWSQKTNLAWNPPIVVKNGDNAHHKAMKSHFTEQTTHYGREAIVSLIKKSGSEHKLGTAYEKFVRLLGSAGVHYIAFDLHKEVGHSKLHNLKQLFDVTDAHVDQHGFWAEGSQKSLQKGVMRTNCKDNLDRTNLIQTRFAIKLGLRQVASLLGQDEAALQPDFRHSVEHKMRLSWADNGDVISVMYAGTPAIRGDHTRTGKTTIKGLFNDAINALSRFYINNFEDGEHQDALDVLLEKRPLSSHYALDLKARPLPKQNKIKSLLASLFLLLFTALKPPSRQGIFLPWAMLWMGLVWLIWFIFRLEPALIARPPVLKWNHVKQKDAPAPVEAKEADAEAPPSKAPAQALAFDVNDLDKDD